MGHAAAVGAVDGVSLPDSKTRLAGVVTDATKAARDEAFGPTTETDIRNIVQDFGVTARGELESLITLRVQERLQQTVRLTLDEALGPTTLAEADALRERLLGQPLQNDLSAAIDGAAPHLSAVVQASLGPLGKEVVTLKTDADSEAAKWKPIAIGFGIGSVGLLVCGVFLILALRSHRKVIESHQKVIELLAQQK